MTHGGELTEMMRTEKRDPDFHRVGVAE